MEIVFTNTEGKRLLWDGMLWSSPDVPGVAALLNQEPLRWGTRHSSIVDRARRQAWEALGAVEETLVDLTGMPEEVIGEDVISEAKELAHREQECKPKGNDPSTKTGSQGSALAQAYAHLCGGVCPDGVGDGDDAEEDWDGCERQWGQLYEWCSGAGMMVEAPGPDLTGGREHDVFFQSEMGRWVKFTKPGLAGFTVDWEESGRPFLRNASPSEYLERLRRQNELFMDGIEFAGMWREGQGGWRIRTTQPDVPGRRATMHEISDGMKALGLVQMGWKGIGYEDSTSWRIGRMGVWDVHPANVIMGENGVVVPVDVIITELPDGFPPCHFHPEANLFKPSPTP